jgi:probable HAF family extracellular repeat protein
MAYWRFKMTEAIMLKRILLCVAITMLLALSAGALAQTYTITDIGVLNGDNESSGFWLNAHGAVVGCSDIANSEGYPCTGTGAGQHAFYWTKSAGMKDLGTLPGGNISGAIGVNDLGQVVGYSNTSTSLLTEYNFIAFEWTSSGGMVNLGKLAGGNSSCAFEINDAGVITGDSFVGSTVVDAASWTDKKIKSLGALSNSIFTAALDINDAGEIVGESIFSYGPPFLNAWHAVKWNVSDDVEDLGTLPGGTYSIGFGINDGGEIVGYGNIADNAAHAMVWTANEGMQDLNNLIPASSGWVLINANAVNDSGQITGYGTKNGHNHAFLLTPVN